MNDYLKACVIDGPKGPAEKITKASFLRFAKENGLHFCGTLPNKTMPEIMAVLDEALTPRKPLDPPGVKPFPSRKERGRPDRCEVKGQRLMRHTNDGRISNLHLDGYLKTVWKYRGFYFVHTFSPADDRCSFDVRSTIAYC